MRCFEVIPASGGDPIGEGIEFTDGTVAIRTKRYGTCVYSNISGATGGLFENCIFVDRFLSGEHYRREAVPLKENR